MSKRQCIWILVMLLLSVVGGSAGLTTETARLIGEIVFTAITLCVLLIFWYHGGPITIDRKKKRIPKKLRGVDRDSDWGYSQHDGWVQGYSFEVVVSSTKNTIVFPLSGSVGTASAKETQTFDQKIDDLPDETETVSTDSGYDSNHLGERIEWTDEGKRTGRRFLCPENRSNAKPKTQNKATKPRDESQRRRLLRKRHLQSKRGKATYRRRGHTVEPFNEWFKSLFELDDRVWHRGLKNNQTQ